MKEMRFNKVFGIGLPRTGTTSLNLALNTLGISSIHFPFSLYTNDDRSILQQYTGFIDTPIPLLYKELDRLCPNSGFILTTRPVEDWLKSMEWLLTEGAKIWGTDPVRDAYKKDFFGSATFDLDLYKTHYFQFHQAVKSYFQNRNDLLILDLDAGYGYKEICQFLEFQPIPQQEYPRGNESRQASCLQKLAYQSGKHNYRIEKLIRQLDFYSKRALKRLK